MNSIARPMLLCSALFVSTLGLSGQAETTALSLEDRLTRLEGALARIEARLNDTVTADELAPALKEHSDLTKALGWDGKSPLPAVKPAGKEKSLALGGFVQANYLSGDAPDSRFTGSFNTFVLRRARINVAGTFAENVSFKYEADFGNNSITPKSGISGQFTDAYMSWTKFSAASVRLGQFKSPFGNEQLTSDTKLLPIERSLTNDSLTLGRQVGAMVYGDLADKRVNYSVALFNGTGTNIGSNDNLKFLKVARVAATVLETKAGTQKVKLTAGANYYNTEDKGTFTGRREGRGLDAQLSYGPAEFQAEWLQVDKHPITGLATAARGWTLLGAYNLTPKWQGMLRYDTYDSNTATAATTTNEWTYGLTYFLKGDDLKLSINYISGEPPAPAVHGDLFVTRVQLIF